MTHDHLLVALRELAGALAPAGVGLTLGGGYGLVLRSIRQRRQGERTRLRQPLPQRGTEDLDLFLDTEIVTSAARMEAIRGTLDRLGFLPVVNFWKFSRALTVDGISAKVEVDLLTGPIAEPSAELVTVTAMRVKPIRTHGLHAYHTPEAFSLALGRQEVDIGEGGERIVVSILHPFSYLILKLFALRDRLQRTSDSKQRYHALDLFAVWASMTEGEWNEVRAWSQEHAEHPTMMEARAICRFLFGNVDGPGVIALRDQLQRQRWRVESDNLADPVHSFRVDLLLLVTSDTPDPS